MSESMCVGTGTHHVTGEDFAGREVGEDVGVDFDAKIGLSFSCFFFFQAEDGIRDLTVTGVQTCALPICGLGADPRPHCCRRSKAPWQAFWALAGRTLARKSVAGTALRPRNRANGCYSQIGRASCRERV